jgi:hypothetical protein
MSEVTESIKDLSRKVSEDYLLLGNSMNGSLIKLANDNEIENSEILKRVCEQCNQNVYLSLFYNPETDKSNIVFDIADFDEISKNIKESEKAMSDYDAPPKDFRSNLEVAVMSSKSPESNETEKLSELNLVVEYRQSLNNLLNKVGIMKTAEISMAENSLNEMAHDTKLMVAKGESIGDICKIASRHIKENVGGEFEKVAVCYDIIKKDLLESNFRVKTGFTKISSQSINKESDMLKPVESFSMSLAKIAGFKEMEDGIKLQIKAFDANIKKVI